MQAQADDRTLPSDGEPTVGASEQRLRNLIENMQDFVIATDLDGRITLVNSVTVTMLGYSNKGDILGRNVGDAICFSQEECERVGKRLALLGSLAHEEVRFRHRDGTRLVVEASFCFAYGTQGAPTGIECVGRDVTSQRQAEAVLRTREAQYRELFEKSRDALMTLAPPTWQFASGNPAAIALFGARGELDFISRAPWQYSPELQPDGRLSAEKARVMIDTAMREGSHYFEWTHKRLTGEAFPATVLLTRMTVEGQTLLQATVRDETERQRYQNELRRAKEEAESATRAKSEFLANMSHELRTPMNAVVGLTHLLLKTELTARQRALLDKVQRSADGMVGLISNILDFSKIETGKLEIEAVEFAIDRLFENVSSALSTKAAEKHLALHFHVGEDVPSTVVGDPLRLGQILLNLAGNAIKFTEQGGVVVSVALAAQVGRTARLRFSVCDTGPGIPAERQKYVFDPFVQVDGSITRRFGGTGLGLAISRQLVEMMAGTISLESQEGAGSTFSFTVSVGLSTTASQGARSSPVEETAGPRVLIVDDTFTGREVLRAYLSGTSFDVHIVSSGEAALEELRNAPAPYDVVLLDWYMPGMEGPEVARRIKLQSEGGRMPRVLLVTGADPDAERSKPVDADGILYKPVTESALLDAIMAVLGEAPSPGRAAQPPSDSASSALVGKRVLVVEDNAINQEVASGVLEDFGMSVVVVGDGRQALATLASDPAFDIVLMDLQMPVMDGYTATQAIRADARTASLPIVALTADAVASERTRCLEGGMAAYLTKPIAPAHLLEVLAGVLQGEPVAPPRVTVRGPLAVPGSPSGAPWPDALPGIDLLAGLRRLMGNHALYLRLLQRFAGEHRADAERIRSALDRRDVPLARSTVHKLKGVAANLSAKQVALTAGRVDTMLRELDTAAVGPEVDALEESMRVVADSVARLGDANSSVVRSVA